MSKALENLENDHSDFDKKSLLDNPPSDPMDLFHTWFEDANNGNDIEVHACSLSTLNKESLTPSSRIVYLKAIEANNFIFYTNYNSQKSKEIKSNPKACMLFFWPNQQRQILIYGSVSKIDSKKSDAYFNSRPRKSKIGAWASDQSAYINSREELLKKFEVIEDQYKNKEIPRPSHWGGYALKAFEIEFWQGRPSRFHDRINFRLTKEKWIIRRKNP